MSVNKRTASRDITKLWLMAMACVLAAAPLKVSLAEDKKADPAALDLKALEEATNSSEAEYEASRALSYPEQLLLGDRRWRKVFDLCEAFVNKYPADPRALQAGQMCLVDIQPFFLELKKPLPPEVIALVEAQKAETDQKKKDEYSHRIVRAMPRDQAYRESWLKRGDAMVAKIAASPGISDEHKEEAQFLLSKRSDALAHRKANYE
jgi:hypothetical protein